MIKIVFFVLNLFIFTTAMAQTDIFTTYSKLSVLDKVSDFDQIETIFIANDSTLIFPVIANQKLPTNGIIIKIPPAIKNFKNLKSLLFIGLYISDLKNELENLIYIENLKFALPIGCNTDSLINNLAKLKTLRTLDLSDSTISDLEISKIKNALLNVKIIKTGFL